MLLNKHKLLFPMADNKSSLLVLAKDGTLTLAVSVGESIYRRIIEKTGLSDFYGEIICWNSNQKNIKRTMKDEIEIDFEPAHAGDGNRLVIKSGESVTEFTLISGDSETEFFEQLNPLFSVMPMVATIPITKKLVKVTDTLFEMLRIGCSANALIVGDKFIKTSDTACVLSLVYDDADCQEFYLTQSLKPLLGFDDLLVFEDPLTERSYYYTSKDDIEAFIAGDRPNIDYPTESEIASVTPLPTDEIVDITGIFDYVKSTAKIYRRLDLRWWQTKLDFGSERIIFEIDAPQLRQVDGVEVPCKTIAELWLPLKYLYSVGDLFIEPVTIQFNNIGPREEHGQSVVFKSSNMTLVLCKMIMKSK
ncbi:hypothetical protein AGMMS50268_19480 [Spirochaetia bacterium]|nr:hypothetical protein AGMMS50268_19480 [Spirochaetia bacterium]